MSLFNLIFVGTKSFGFLFLLKKEKKNFYTIMEFFLEVEHVKNIFELWILIFFLFVLKAQLMTTHAWMNGCIQ
jgi:hypothetical protein